MCETFGKENSDFCLDFLDASMEIVADYTSMLSNGS